MNFPTIRLASKPHVIQFLKGHLPLAQAPYHHFIIARKEILLSIVKGSLTEEPTERLLKIPDHYESIEVLLPSRYRSSYVAQQDIDQLARSLEEYYWLKCKLFVLHRLSHGQYMDTAISAFKDEYGITESQYPIGNMRRQMNRKGITGIQAAKPELPKRLSYVLTNAEVKQVHRLKTQRGLSLSTLAHHYGISKSGIKNIIEKYSMNMSKKSTKNERLLAY